jgi:hypothetical protein
VPAFLIAKGANPPPLAALPLSALVYSLGYGALYYALGRRTAQPFLQSAPTAI